jgi:hypothetical protein
MGDRLGADEAHALLRAMDGVPVNAHCPHGRPVAVQLKRAQSKRCSADEPRTGRRRRRPTATGKTRSPWSCAERSTRKIVSADARQIYRGFDIGTAKPTPPSARGAASLPRSGGSDGPLRRGPLSIGRARRDRRRDRARTPRAGRRRHGTLRAARCCGDFARACRRSRRCARRSRGASEPARPAGAAGLRGSIRLRLAASIANDHVRLLRVLEVALATGVPLGAQPAWPRIRGRALRRAADRPRRAAATWTHVSPGGSTA